MTRGDPTEAIVVGVDQTLQLARTWLNWDGRPFVSEGGDRIYTPHKVIRRYADHLIDHFAQIEGLLAGRPTEGDGWHGSLVTSASDWASFTEVDLVEATQRLRRLARLYVMRLGRLDAAQWDEPRGPDWTLREIVEHVAPAWYAEQIGDLAMRRA